MRLRLEIRRHDLPLTKIAWNTSGLHAYTAAAKNAAAGTLVSQLLQDVNALIPLESEEWGLEDYIVEHDGYECLHFSYLEQILADGDLLIIRPLETPEVRSRRVSGRDQISVDGRHLHDGVAFGQPLTRFIQRPSIRIPPRKKARLALEPKSDELEPEAVEQSKKVERPRKEYKGLIDEQSTGRGLAITGAGINTPRVKTLKGVSFSKANVSSDVVETPATVVWADEMDEDDDDDEDFAGETSEDSTSSEEDDESDSDVSSSESNKENIAPSTELLPRRHKMQRPTDENESDTSDTEVNSTRMDEVDEVTTSEEDRDSEDSSSVESESSSSSESSESSESSVSSAAESVVSPPKEVATTSRKRKAETDLAQEVLKDKVAKEKSVPKEKPVLTETQEKPKATPAPTQTFVPPGEGLTKTQRRNQRRKIKVKVDRLKEQGLLNDDSTAEEVEAQLAIYDAQQSRSGASVAEEQNIVEPAPTAKEPVNGIHDAKKEAVNGNGTHEQNALVDSTATEEPQLNKRQLKRQRQKELKAQEKADFEKRKDDLMTSIANGGVDVMPAPPIAKDKEPQVETSSVEVPDSQIPPAESTPASTASRRLDIGSAQRLLFGALGLRTPKNKEEADKLRTKLDTLNPRRSVPVVIPEAPQSETAQENTTTDIAHNAVDQENENEDDDDETTSIDKAAALAGGYEYDPNWRDKIVVSAVECIWDIEFPPPPFPFVQRWHGIKYSDLKKRKRNSRNAERPHQKTKEPLEAEYAEDAIELDYDGKGTPKDGLASAETENDLPSIPDDVESLPLLEIASAKAGMVICYKVLEVTAQTKWQPQVSKPLTAEILNVDGTKLEMRLAKRDQPQREIDPLTGEKIYSNFELRSDDDEDGEEHVGEDVGLVELDFAELIRPRIIHAPASLDENSAGLITLSTGAETTQSGPQDSMEYQFAQIVAPLGQSESAPSLQIQQDEDMPNANDESNIPPSVQMQTTSREDEDVEMDESQEGFIIPEDHDEREMDMFDEDVVPETLFHVNSSPTPMPMTPPAAEDVSTESHGYVSAVSALADAIQDEDPDTPLPAPITQSTSASLPPALHFNSTGSFEGSLDFEENELPDLNDFISASQAHWSQAPRSRRAETQIEAAIEEEEDLPQTVPALTSRVGPPPGSQIIDITLSSDVDVPTSKSQPVPSTRLTSAARKKKKKAW